MPISDPKVVLEFFGIEADKFESDDAFREAAAKDWTKVSEASKPGSAVERAALGRFNGIARTKAKAAYKALGIPTDGIDFDKIDALDLFDPLAEGATKVWSEKEAQLTEKLKGKGSEEAKKEFERQIAEQAKKVSEYENTNAALRGEIENIRKAEKEREINAKIEAAWEQASGAALKDVKFKNDLEKKGFYSEARERYRVGFDEKGETYWAGKDGNRIPDGSKHQAFKGGDQLLRELAAELKVGDANPRAGERVGQRQHSMTVEKTGGSGSAKVRTIATPGPVLSDAVSRA